jgi:hypothetical protein
MSYTFIKMGIGTTSLSWGAFFGLVKINIGGVILSLFKDLKNAILRANMHHPYASKLPFVKDNPRIGLSLS